MGADARRRALGYHQAAQAWLDLAVSALLRADACARAADDVLDDEYRVARAVYERAVRERREELRSATTLLEALDTARMQEQRKQAGRAA